MNEIKLNDKQIEEIAQLELFEAILMNLEPDYCESGYICMPDWCLIDALERSLQYFCNPTEWLNYSKQIQRRRIEIEERIVDEW